MTPPSVLLTQVTDQYGEVRHHVPLVVRVEGPNVFLECEDGTSRMVDRRELIEAASDESEREAA